MRMETTEEEPQTQTQTKRITIPFERYEQIAKSILRYMTRTEEAESNGEFFFFFWHLLESKNIK